MISRYHFYLSFVTSAILFELQNLHFALKFIQSLTFLQEETDFLYWLTEWLGATNHTLCLAWALCTVTSTSIIFSLVKIVLLFFRWDCGVWRWKKYISCKTTPFRPICFSCSQCRNLRHPFPYVVHLYSNSSQDLLLLSSEK